MNRKRIALLAVFAIALAIPLASVTGPSAAAQATQVRVPVSFTLTGCTSLPAGLVVNGSGESFVVINSRIDKDGVTHIEENDLVTGTAVDSNGASYVFNYHNHTSLTIPSSGFPFSLQTNDHFNLVGNGRANQLQVHFVARATFFSPTVFTIEFINVHGDPFTCDPI